MAAAYGYSATVIKIGNNPGDRRIYYQKASDYGIYEKRSGVPDLLIVSGDLVRDVTPLAAVALDNKFDEILVYYISTNNILCEKRYYAGKWEDGGLNAQGNKASRGSDFLYAYGGPVGNERLVVGFLPSGEQNKVKEAVYNNNTGWGTRYP